MLYNEKKQICISEKEYKELKAKEKIDDDLLKQIADSLADLKAGNIKRIA
ncbi:hypothetical protein GF336_04265 [Candidatus Woesearchaeota archaeon]|nr:hypothetical protein [Candidatus Woesearchaeota archaeon]